MMLSMTNIRAGGRTPVSSVLYALLLLNWYWRSGSAASSELVPHAVLAGILLKIGWDTIDWRLLRRVHRIRREYAVVMLTTLVLTAFVDLITGVAIGLIAAGMAHALQLESLELDSVISVPLLDSSFLGQPDGSDTDPYSARVGLVQLKGRFTVASSHKLITVIGADIKDHEVVIFDFSGATHLDDSAAMVIDRLMEIATEERTEFILMGLSGNVSHILYTLGILHRVPGDRLVETLDEARATAGDILAA